MEKKNSTGWSCTASGRSAGLAQGAEVPALAVVADLHTRTATEPGIRQAHFQVIQPVQPPIPFAAVPDHGTGVVAQAMQQLFIGLQVATQHMDIQWPAALGIHLPGPQVRQATTQQGQQVLTRRRRGHGFRFHHRDLGFRGKGVCRTERHLIQFGQGLAVAHRVTLPEFGFGEHLVGQTLHQVAAHRHTVALLQLDQRQHQQVAVGVGHLDKGVQHMVTAPGPALPVKPLTAQLPGLLAGQGPRQPGLQSAFPVHGEGFIRQVSHEGTVLAAY